MTTNAHHEPWDPIIRFLFLYFFLFSLRPGMKTNDAQILINFTEGCAK